MKSCALVSFLGVAAASDLAVTWSDCGAKHAKTTDIQPSLLPLGSKTALTGTGTVDEDVTGGTYDMELKAGGGLIDSHFTGNNCEAKSFNLPLGLGTLDWDGITCPLKAGTANIGFHVTLASSLPASLATSDITLHANDQNSESVLCVQLHLASETLEVEAPELEVTGGTLDLTWKDCGDASTHGVIKGIDKSSISLGSDTTVTGSGTTDEAIEGGDFTISAKAGLITQKYQGKVCEAKVFDLPLGLGQINWKGLSCPAAAGDIDVAVGVKLSAIIPASMATSDIEVSATGSSTDDKLLCMSLHTAKAAVVETLV